MSHDSLGFLRRVLIIDAVTSGASALLLLIAGNALSNVLRVPASLLHSSAVSLVPFAIFVAYVAWQRETSHAAVWTIIALNASWLVASLWVVTGSGMQPTSWGKAAIIAQALAVGILAELQYVGIRRMVPRRAVS